MEFTLERFGFQNVLIKKWSASEGYPDDPDYREYYRDIGYDLEEEYIKDYIHPSGIGHNTGFLSISALQVIKSRFTGKRTIYSGMG